VGDIHPRRNLDRAAEAFRQVRSSDHRVVNCISCWSGAS
jgi:hypothetical protein